MPDVPGLLFAQPVNPVVFQIRFEQRIIAVLDRYGRPRYRTAEGFGVASRERLAPLNAGQRITTDQLVCESAVGSA